MSVTVISLRERQRHERRAEILRVARDVFLDRGYAGASMDEVAERTGVAKGTIYLHFATKDDLLVELWREAVHELLDRLVASLDEPGTSVEKLARSLALFGDFSNCHINLVLAATPAVKVLVRERLRDEWPVSQVIGRLAELVREGQAEGAITPGMQPEVVAALLLALPHVAAQLGDLLGDQAPTTSALDTVAAIFFNGILLPASASAAGEGD